MPHGSAAQYMKLAREDEEAAVTHRYADVALGAGLDMRDALRMVEEVRAWVQPKIL